MKKTINTKAGYADCYVLPIQKKNITLYRKMAKKAGSIWIEYGALDYKECAGDDLNVQVLTPFTKMMKTKPGETVVFAWVTFKSKSHRDKVNKSVLKDPRLSSPQGTMKMPFDMKRMVYGGFKIIVDEYL